MPDSTRRDGNPTTPSAASVSVIECETVNAVTTAITPSNALRKRADRNPASVAPHQHRRQQQRDQEQQVVVADPDVMHAVGDELQELAPARGIGEIEILHGLRGRQHGRAHGAVDAEIEQAAVAGIDVEQKAIADFDSMRGRRAKRREVQHRIAAIAVRVGEDIAADTTHALPSARRSSRAIA